MIGRSLAAAALLASCTAAEPQQSALAAPARPDMEEICKGKTEWSDPGPPVAIFGNVYHVGTCTITVLLVTTPEGHVLFDAGPEESVPSILANIRALGFDPGDVKWIVSSHEHWDHAGGLAALKAATGAKLAANQAEVAALQSGKPYPEDPQATMLRPIAPVTVDRAMADGETLELGGLTVTMHATPAHAPGSTSWTWTSCAASDCKAIAFLDSASTPAPDGYRFSDHPARLAQFRTGLAVMAALPCDILLTPHPGQSAMYERYAGKAPLIDPQACAAYARAAGEAMDERLAQEANAKSGETPNSPTSRK